MRLSFVRFEANSFDWSLPRKIILRKVKQCAWGFQWWHFQLLVKTLSNAGIEGGSCMEF